MLFTHVAIAGLAHIDAPHALSSADINARLQPTMDRLGIKTDVLQDIAGIHSRRMWDDDIQASDAATLAAEKALLDAGVTREKIGLLVNTSVSRDFLEPSTASIVSRQPGPGRELPELRRRQCLPGLPQRHGHRQPHDRARRDRIRADRRWRNRQPRLQKTLERLSAPDVTEEQFRNELASLTLGCGAAAMVLARAELVPGRAALQGRRHQGRHAVELAVPRQPRPHGHRHPHAADRGPQARAEDLRRRPPRAGLGGRGNGPVRDPPGQPRAHRRPSSRPSASTRRKC